MIFSACNAKDQGFRLDVNNLGMKEFCQVGSSQRMVGVGHLTFTMASS